MLGALFVFRLRVFLSSGIFFFYFTGKHEARGGSLYARPDPHIPSRRRYSLPAMALDNGASAPTPPGSTSASTTTQPSKRPSCKSDMTLGKLMLLFPSGGKIPCRAPACKFIRGRRASAALVSYTSFRCTPHSLDTCFSRNATVSPPQYT